jgi:UDP-GlcNAc:undecaprenyl-phosphate GlcNAc-1-phosphate transferase
MMSYLLAFSITINFLFILKSIAAQIGLVDKPNHRKVHQNQTPLIGGLAMFGGFIFTLLMIEQTPSGLRYLMSGAIILIIIGFLDDLYELSHYYRFAVEIIAALLICLGGGTMLNDLGAIGFSDQIIELGIFSIPLTVFAIIGVINALNMSDGIDGLAGSLTLVTLLALVILTGNANLIQALKLLGLLIAVISAFLAFNLRVPGRAQAQVFMGDTGSMFLGFILAWFMINLSQGESRVMTPVTALWIFALPLIDTVSIMLRRIFTKRSPFSADRGHFHHLLLSAGFSVSQTLTIMIGLATALAMIGLIGFYLQVSENIMFFGFLCLFFLHFSGTMYAHKNHHFLGCSMFKQALVENRTPEKLF